MSTLSATTENVVRILLSLFAAPDPQVADLLRDPRASPGLVGWTGWRRSLGFEPGRCPALDPAAPLFTSATPAGLSPSEIRAAYGVNQINFGTVTGNGAGQTIAIVDAYYDPNITLGPQRSSTRSTDCWPRLRSRNTSRAGCRKTTRGGPWKSRSTWSGPTRSRRGQHRPGRGPARPE